MSLSLFIDNLKRSLQKRTKITQNSKSYSGWQSRGYINAPRASIIFESHNKSLQIIHLVEKLRQYSSDIEIIVIDDGSDLSHTQALAKYLTRGNEFLVRANDLYENVMYDRTIRLANSNYVALLQDDDDFDDFTWIDRAIELMQSHPKLAILGGMDAMDVVFDDDTHRGHGGPFPHGEEFCFAPTVNRAPMWINRQLFLQYIGHIDFDYAPFQYDDYEMCLRAWLQGVQVGWYKVNVKSLTVGGMRLWNNAFTQEQCLRNGPRLYDTYKTRIDEIHTLVQQANRK